MWPAWINIAFGIWVVLSGFLYLAPWNFFTSGFFIAFFGFLQSRRQWQGVANGILGVWLMLSAFSADLVSRWNLWITGLLVVGLAVWRSRAALRDNIPPPA